MTVKWNEQSKHTRCQSELLHSTTNKPSVLLSSHRSCPVRSHPILSQSVALSLLHAGMLNEQCNQSIPISNWNSAVNLYWVEDARDCNTSYQKLQFYEASHFFFQNFISNRSIKSNKLSLCLHYVQHLPLNLDVNFHQTNPTEQELSAHSWGNRNYKSKSFCFKDFAISVPFCHRSLYIISLVA